MLQHHRSGTVLIIVAAISALLASLALTFLARMRSDVASSQLVMREAQSHIMLAAACNFIMERSRLGYDPPPLEGEFHSRVHREGFGWIDVRDGQPGPKDETGQLIGINPGATGTIMEPWTDLSNPNRPAIRCPMYVMKRPPYAVMPTVARNPIGTKPYMINPDPYPAVKPGQWEEYAKGDKEPDLMRKQSSWFRVWRATANTFVVTCGAGETQGFKDWNEVYEAGKSGEFGGDNDQAREIFAFLQSQETYLHYLVEWSPHVLASDYQHLQNEKRVKTVPTYAQRGLNASQESRSQGRLVNPVGTIRSIQRLLNTPDNW